ncbi:MAG: hypothetical protein ACFHWX_07630 [Bacteroidota bacterium]
MKVLILTFLIVLSTDPIEISRINKTKREAASAYSDGNYELAAAKYKILTDSMGVDEDEVYLNMGHSYYHLNDSANATNAYNQLIESPNKEIKSIAYQQLGVMAKNNHLLNVAENLLKSSLRTNPGNVDARYDYEIVKKLLQEENEQKQQNQDNQNQDQDDQNQDQQDQEDQQNQDQQDQQDKESEQDSEEQQQDQNNQDGEEGEKEEQQQQEGEQQKNEEQENQQPGTKEKLEEMNISEEKAQMILEAMKNNEFQYIQQRKRKPTKQQDPNRPDW